MARWEERQDRWIIFKKKISKTFGKCDVDYKWTLFWIRFWFTNSHVQTFANSMFSIEFPPQLFCTRKWKIIVKTISFHIFPFSNLKNSDSLQHFTFLIYVFLIIIFRMSGSHTRILPIWCILHVHCSNHEWINTFSTSRTYKGFQILKSNGRGKIN